MREIRISKALNGLLVNVGCQTLVFNSTEEFITELWRYLGDPAGTEKEFLSRYGVQPFPEAVPAQDVQEWRGNAEMPAALRGLAYGGLQGTAAPIATYNGAIGGAYSVRG